MISPKLLGVVFLGFLVTTGVASAETITKGKDFLQVRYSENMGYTIITQGSGKQEALGLLDAPYVDSNNTRNDSIGIDSIAFIFDKNGVLAGFPIYISDFGLSGAQNFYINRCKALIVGKSTESDVRELFPNVVHGRPQDPNKASPQLKGQKILFAMITTHNPASNDSGSR